MRKINIVVFLLFLCLSCTLESPLSLTGTDKLNTSDPLQTVKICFIHHSTGSAWINKSGGLGTALNAHNFYVTECDYGWDAEPDDDLGDHTDTGNWSMWFNNTKMPYVYANESNFDYTNTIAQPAGENSIIMFKSCYPSSEVGDSIDDEKEIYTDLLGYFSAHRDKMFVLIIPPPEISIDSASLTRELSQWLVDRENGWLSSYVHNNVYAFNYYNILTDPNNHHYVNSDGKEENLVSARPIDPFNPDELYYHSGGDDHPTGEGHQKASAEFLPLLCGWYNNWKSGIH